MPDFAELIIQEQRVQVAPQSTVQQVALSKDVALFIVGLSSILTAVILTLITVVLSILFFSKQPDIRQALLGAFIVDFMSLLILSILIGIRPEDIVERLGDGFWGWGYVIGIQILIVVLLSAASSISAILIAFFHRQIEDSKFEELY